MRPENRRCPPTFRSEPESGLPFYSRCSVKACWVYIDLADMEPGSVDTSGTASVDSWLGAFAYLCNHRFLSSDTQARVDSKHRIDNHHG